MIALAMLLVSVVFLALGLARQAWLLVAMMAFTTPANAWSLRDARRRRLQSTYP